MKYFVRSTTLLFLMQFILSGCVQDMVGDHDIHLQLRPDKPTERIVENEMVSYVLPNYLVQGKNIKDILQFYTFHYGSESKQEKLRLTQDKFWKIERRTDNGCAGSGVIYEIEVLQKNLGDMTQINFVIRKENKYQEGLVLPFAIPDFDIKQYLSRATIKYQFELNSVYSVNSVESNFERILGKVGDGVYFWETKFAIYKNLIKFYPYRDGSKLVIESSIKTHDQDNTIDVSRIIKDLEVKFKEILDS